MKMLLAIALVSLNVLAPQANAAQTMPSAASDPSTSRAIVLAASSTANQTEYGPGAGATIHDGWG